MIRVRQLTKWYGPILAVDHLDLDAEAGTIVGFLGPNGAGKTTTLRILTCFMPATSGSATVNGHNVFADSLAVRRSIGYLPEDTPLYPEMRVSEHLHYFGKLQGMSRAARRRAIGKVSQQCGLDAIIHRQVGQLSKGNRQRVGLAQALLHDPPVLILDEPTVGLDPVQIIAMRNLLLELGKTKTILLSTHILPEAQQTCDRLAVICRGRLVAHGTPEELRRQVRRSEEVVAELKGPADEVRKSLGAIRDVTNVTTTDEDGWCRATIATSGPDVDVREAVAAAAVRRQWPLRELHLAGATLEDFYAQVTQDQAIAQAG